MTSSRADQRRLATVTLFALSAITIAIYAGALAAPFMFDDFIYIVDNPYLSPPDLAKLLAYMPSRAVGMLSLALNVWVHGFDPVGFRLVNLFIHLCSGGLVFGLVLLLLDELRGRTPRDVALAAGAAGIFLAHPLQVQAVTYVWQRVASLAACFYLAALLLHLVARQKRRAQHEGHNARWAPWLLAALVCGVVGMLTKQTVFTLPFAIVLLTWLCGGADSLKRDRPLLVAWAPTLLVIPLLMIAFGDRQAIDIAEGAEHARTPWVYFLTQWEAVALYWRLAVLPFGQSVIHDLPSGSLASARTWLFGALHAAILIVAYRARLKGPLLTAGVLFAYLSLSVESTFVPLLDEVFEHRMYLPMFGVALVAIALAEAWVERSPALQDMAAGRAAVIAVLLTVPLAGFTVQRNAVWSDTVRLWTEAAHNAPTDHTAQYNAALSFVREQRFAEAIPFLEATLKLRPTNTDAVVHLGTALCETERCEEAVSVLQPAYERDPTPLVVEAYATTLARLGRFTDAADVMEATPPSRPSGAMIHGRLLIDAGRPEQALVVVERALDAAPPSARGGALFKKLEHVRGEARNAIEAKALRPDGGPPTPSPTR